MDVVFSLQLFIALSEYNLYYNNRTVCLRHKREVRYTGHSRKVTIAQSAIHEPQSAIVARVI